jgi:multiple sugar transport system permease protein
METRRVRIRPADVYSSQQRKAVARRRWARTGSIYVLLMFFSLFFMGPLVFAFMSSLKDNPTDWPPQLGSPQLSPVNWGAAYRLGRSGGGGGLFGAFAPGAVVPFSAMYEVDKGEVPEPPIVVVPQRVPGAGAGAVRLGPFAADEAEVSEVREVSREEVDGKIRVTYEWEIGHKGELTYDRLPMDVEVPLYQKFVSATLAPNRLERLGRVQSWNNVTSGVIPYVFYNYHRVFRENYSRTTGRSLFLMWIRNSFLLSGIRVATTLFIASMAGYALARLDFTGRSALFYLTLFSMMIPGQVTFISNYLVLRDGIFGLSKLFGVDTLINTCTRSVAPSIEEERNLPGKAF